MSPGVMRARWHMMPSEMGDWTLAWGDEHRPVVVRDSAHLDELLDEAAEEATASQTMAELVSPRGVSCSIGLGRPTSVATFMASAAEPPYFVSRGEGSAKEALVFFYNGHWTEFGGAEAIPVADAVAALREFYDTGDQPTGIAWQEV